MITSKTHKIEMGDFMQQIMNTKEAAKYLGMSQKYMYQLIWRKKLFVPYRKTPAGRILFDLADLENWFHSLPKYMNGEEMEPEEVQK